MTVFTRISVLINFLIIILKTVEKNIEYVSLYCRKRKYQLAEKNIYFLE